MQYRIQHITKYHYSRDVDLGPHIVRLRPAVHAKSKVLSYSLSVSPDCQMRWQYDPWNNLIARLAFAPDKKYRELSICVDVNIELTPINPFDFYVESWCEQLPFDYPEEVKKELLPFLEKPESGPLLQEFLRNFPLEGSLVDYLVNLNSVVFNTIKYVQREEAGIQSSEETLALKSGSCRDSARLIMDVLRLSGLAARFVSGYLLQETDSQVDGNPEMKLDLHAWTEVYLPGAGWVGLDGTSGLLCSEGHIPLACTVTPEQAAPIFGTASEAAVRFEVESSVCLLGNEVSPDKPYSDESFREILKLGDAVDSLLENFDVVLTSGGEPTFTSTELSSEPEWFTQALGETKWSKASELFTKIYDQFGEGPLPVVGTGKLYPGEDEPRWSLSLIWREDGEPIWLNRDLLNWSFENVQNLDRSASKKAEEFLMALSEKLSVAPNIIPGFEDPVQLVISEENLPVDEDLSEFASALDLDDRDERKRLARIIDQGAGDAVGLALPLTKLRGAWYSNDWQFKRDKMYLLPGRSPMGLRLPLERIKSEIESDFVQDPSLAQVDEQLPRRGEGLGCTTGDDHQIVSSTEAVVDASATTVAAIEEDPKLESESELDDEALEGNALSPVTALCVESRMGYLGVFLPPVATADDYLNLIEAIEEAAVMTAVKIQVEGYGPPPDSRLRTIGLTPDPGVLEVNMPVARSLRQYARALELVSDSATQCGLGTEKYQLDGRIVGTGGGHHITLGGPTTLESPFIKHPYILASMVRYFQNHPSLSFLFTGLFVGPHSQAPRIDEARLESLYELELALGQFPSGDEDAPPWLTDRLLRNILVDMTGNTHRAEICIDKLYSPESQTGRLGLVELRAFEMPAHHHMAIVQVLLIRAIIARFLVEPYKEKLIAFGEALHDKFMLPHYLYQDLCDLIDDLNGHGIEIKKEWFLPFRDLRFPVLGRLIKEDVQLELRTAHEPWFVLSVFDAGSSVARPVDSSMERIQVKVTNLNENRHKVVVNGVELPLTQTNSAGEFVSAVRFRAWQPPQCMHPNIEVHHPLKFELVDTWSKRSLGACQYHVVHPEGKLYEELPVTRHDARARLNRRFTEGNHTPWPVNYVPASQNGLVSLDLRQYQKVHEC